MTPGDLRHVHHVGDTVKHAEIISHGRPRGKTALPEWQLCAHARTENSSLYPGYAGCGDVELREPLTVLSDPSGWRYSTLWSER